MDYSEDKIGKDIEVRLKDHLDSYFRASMYALCRIYNDRGDFVLKSIGFGAITKHSFGFAYLNSLKESEFADTLRAITEPIVIDTFDVELEREAREKWKGLDHVITDVGEVRKIWIAGVEHAREEEREKHVKFLECIEERIMLSTSTQIELTLQMLQNRFCEIFKIKSDPMDENTKRKDQFSDWLILQQNLALDKGIYLVVLEKFQKIFKIK